MSSGLAASNLPLVVVPSLWEWLSNHRWELIHSRWPGPTNIQDFAEYDEASQGLIRELGIDVERFEGV